MNVLIVDDSLLMRMIVAKGLRHAGFCVSNVVQATNGRDALEKIERAESDGAKFDLIVTDIHMPFMDGPDMVDEMRRRGLGEGVPVVLITAEEVDIACLGDRAAGRLTRLIKPFTIEQMRARLTPLLQPVAEN